MADYRNEIQKLYIAYYGRPADYSGLEYWNLQANNAGGVTASIIDNFGTSAEATSRFGSMTVEARINDIYLSTFGRAAETAGSNYWVGEYIAGRVTLAGIASAVVNGAKNDDATVVANKLTASTSFTNSLAADSAKQIKYTGTAAADSAKTWLATVTSSAASVTTATASIDTTIDAMTGVATTGSTFTLTSATNTMNGTSGNDTFVGDRVNEGGVANVQTLNANDSLDGGAGTDTLLATLGASVTPAQLKNIEIINVSNAAAANLTLTNADSVTTIKTSGNTNAIVFDGLSTKLTGGLEITNNAQNVTVTTTATALTGSADELTVKLQSVTAGTLSVDTASGVNGYETITINSTGSVANTLGELNDGAATSLATLKVIGDKDLTITNALAAEIKTVDATGYTGKLTTTLTNAAVHTVTGGSGDDTFVFGGTFVGAENATVASRDTINGGAGNDTLSVTSAIAVAASAAAQTTVSNIEIIKISDASAGNVDLTKFTGATTLSFGHVTIGAHSYALSNGNTVEFITGDHGDNARTFAISGSGTTDALTLKHVAGSDMGTGLQTFSGVEVLNIQTGTVAGTAVEIGGAITLTPSAGGTGKIVATGVNQLTMTGVVTANEVDASGMTGNALLSMAATSAGAIRVTGTEKNDAIRGSTANDVLIGGAGDDTIHTLGGSDTVTGGTGNDTIINTVATTGGITTITDFDAGTASTASDLLHLTLANINAYQGEFVTAVVDLSTGGAANVTTGTLTTQTLAADNTALAAGTEIVILAGTFADDTAALASVKTAGANTFTLTAVDDNDAILIAYSTGTDLKIAVAQFNGAATSSNDIDGFASIVTLSGISTFANIDASDLILI